MITLFKKAKTRIQHRSDANKITEKRKKTTSWCKKRKRIGSKKYIWVQRDLKVLSFNLLLCSVWFQLIVSSVQQTFVIESLCRSRHRLSFFPFVFCVRYKLRCHFRVRRSECMGETSGASSTHILEKQMKRIIKLYFFISLARIYMRNAISHIWQRTTHTRLHHTWLLPQKKNNNCCTSLWKCWVGERDDGDEHKKNDSRKGISKESPFTEEGTCIEKTLFT